MVEPGRFPGALWASFDGLVGTLQVFTEKRLRLEGFTGLTTTDLAVQRAKSGGIFGGNGN